MMETPLSLSGWTWPISWHYSLLRNAPYLLKKSVQLLILCEEFTTAKTKKAKKALPQNINSKQLKVSPLIKRFFFTHIFDEFLSVFFFWVM